MNNIKEYFIIIYPAGKVQYLGITPFNGMRPDEYLPQFICDTVMSNEFDYVNCDNNMIQNMELELTV